MALRSGVSGLLIALVTVVTGGGGRAVAAPPASGSDPGGRDVVVATPGTPAAAEPAVRPDTAVWMREHAVTDPGMNGAVAVTLLVPRGWTVAGGITRPDQRLANMPVMTDIEVTAPDGRQVHLYPTLTFEWVPSAPAQPFAVTSNGNFYLAPPDAMGQFLLGLSQADPEPGVSNVRLVTDEPAVELTREIQKAAAPFYQLVRQMQTGDGIATAFDTRASRVVFTYDQDGRAYEETFFVCWQYLVTTMNGEVFNGSWAITSMRSSRGRPGSDYLRDPVLTAIFQSLRVDPKWQAEMDRYWAELSRVRARGNAVAIEEGRQRAELTRQTTAHIADSMNETWKYGQALRGRQGERVADSMLDQTKYNTADGETVKLPAYYDHVYTDGEGNYLLHNEVAWDPNRHLSVNEKPWQRIEKTP